MTQGQGYIQTISLRKDLGGGQYGPEILVEDSLSYDTYIPDQSAYALDRIVGLAQQYNVYLKLVLGDKDDPVWHKLDDDGTYVYGGEPDNLDGYYGNGRNFNKTRWLQQAWWRYLQARWGYSTNIHSWEFTNEGDPAHSSHYAVTDELGKFMHCKAFGVNMGSGDSQPCNYNHPNDHLVTTSFWHSFPGTELWENPAYPNVDYADVHAYISTSNVIDFSSPCSKAEMENDFAAFHLCHSQQLVGWNLGKPIVRGETGFDYADNQTEQKDLQLDDQGIGLHNFIWSGMDEGALTEVYWWGGYREGNPGVDGQPGLHEHYKYFYQFISNVPLNNGHYQALGAQVGNSNLRVVGQKDLVNQNAHLWIQNKNHTWRHVVDNTPVSPASGTITIPGFQANQTYQLKTWNTYTGTVATTSNLTSDSSGAIALAINNLTTDTAYQINNPSAPTPTSSGVPTGTPTPLNRPCQLVGDSSCTGSCDNVVNILDYTSLLTRYATTAACVDMNADSSVNILDYTVISQNFGRTLP